MKKKIFSKSVILLAVTGAFLWFFVQDKVAADATDEWSEQKIVVKAVQTDVDGLGVDAVINHTGANPSLVFSCTNDSNVDMCTIDYKAFYKKNGEWKELLIDGTYYELLISYAILCMDTLNECNSKLENPESQNREVTFGYTPWNKYLNMNQVGEYRFELSIGKAGSGIDGQLGTVWVEWTQESK